MSSTESSLFAAYPCLFHLIFLLIFLLGLSIGAKHKSKHKSKQYFIILKPNGSGAKQ
jgi:hypothetical protein